MEFVWRGFTENDFVNYCAKMENGMVDDLDYIGCVRVGDLCFDLLVREYDGEMILTYDLYVGGVDSGYGYGDGEYPYDYADGGDFEDTCIWMTYEDFKEQAEKEFEKFINNSKYSEASLIDKANERLRVW